MASSFVRNLEAWSVFYGLVDDEPERSGYVVASLWIG